MNVERKENKSIEPLSKLSKVLRTRWLRCTCLIDGNERATASAVNLNERFNTDAEPFE